MDGQDFHVGRMRLTAIHTLGHTDESMSHALIDATLNDAPIMVCTGDTLFVGDVGRTNLYGSDEAPRLAENLYNSILNKILPLGDSVILCQPTEQGGFAAARSVNENRAHWAWNACTTQCCRRQRDAFIKFKIGERHERPAYFRKMEQYNLEGPPLLKNLPDPQPIPAREFQERMKQGAVIVDVAVDQGGCAETTRPTSHDDPIYLIDGVVHYCVANMPGVVALTATLGLTNTP